MRTRGHELRYLEIGGHTRNAVITPGDDTEQVTVMCAVIGDGNGAVTVALDKLKNIGKRVVGCEV